MIAVDTSVLVAIVLGEQTAEALLHALTSTLAVSAAANILEARIVAEAHQEPNATRQICEHSVTFCWG